MSTPNDNSVGTPSDDAGYELLANLDAGGVSSSLPAPGHEIYTVIYDCAEALYLIESFLSYKGRQTEPQLKLRDDAQKWVDKTKTGSDTGYHRLPHHFSKEELEVAIRRVRHADVADVASLSNLFGQDFDADGMPQHAQDVSNSGSMSGQLGLGMADEMPQHGQEADGLNSMSNKFGLGMTGYREGGEGTALLGRELDSFISNDPSILDMIRQSNVMSPIPEVSNLPASTLSMASASQTYTAGMMEEEMGGFIGHSPMVGTPNESGYGSRSQTPAAQDQKANRM
jgi:hypothetical protein